MRDRTLAKVHHDFLEAAVRGCVAAGPLLRPVRKGRGRTALGVRGTFIEGGGASDFFRDASFPLRLCAILSHHIYFFKDS